MLFSATTTKKTEDLVKVALKKELIYIRIEEKTVGTMVTVEGLEQGYVICPSEKRFLLLLTFLKKNRNKKKMVFFSSCMSDDPNEYIHRSALLLLPLPLLLMSHVCRVGRTARDEGGKGHTLKILRPEELVFLRFGVTWSTCVSKYWCHVNYWLSREALMYWVSRYLITCIRHKYLGLHSSPGTS